MTDKTTVDREINVDYVIQRLREGAYVKDVAKELGVTVPQLRKAIPKDRLKEYRDAMHAAHQARYRKGLTGEELKPESEPGPEPKLEAKPKSEPKFEPKSEPKELPKRNELANVVKRASPTSEVVPPPPKPQKDKREEKETENRKSERSPFRWLWVLVGGAGMMLWMVWRFWREQRKHVSVSPLPPAPTIRPEQLEPRKRDRFESLKNKYKVI